MDGLKRALDTLSVEVPSINEYTLASEVTKISMLSIAPLNLVYHLLDYPFLTPCIVWHLFTSRAMALG